jgi:hypothetical protein
VSEQQAEETHGEFGSLGTGSILPPSADTPSEQAADLAVSVLASPAIAPDHEALPKADVPNAAKSEAPRAIGKLMIMAPSDRAWHYMHSSNAEVKSETRTAAAPSAPPPQSAPPKGNFGTMAAMLALAVIAGAIGGALATTGLTHVADAGATTVPATAPVTSALEASIARIDADIVALKSGLEHTTKQGATQFNKTSDRLDKIEKAQAEPAAKLAKLTDAVEKLRTAPPAAPVAAVAAAPAAAAPAASKDITGSVTPPQTVAAATPAAPAASPTPATPGKPEMGRLPTVEGWSLADVGYGAALIRGQRGTFEVYAGDYIPGLGRIDAIRKQDGQWVVVTSKGLVVRR